MTWSAAQGFVVPEGAEALLAPWIEAGGKSETWGNAREVRTLLEKSRDAQAVRLAADPGEDLDRLTADDMAAAMGERR